MPAPANAPMLQLPCSPGISTRRSLRSTAMACVFIATSSVPWNAPQTKQRREQRGQAAGEPD